MTRIFESTIEEFVVGLLEDLGWDYLSPEDQELERANLGEVVLKSRLKGAIERLNPNLPEEARDQALRQILNLPSQNLIGNNEVFHKLLTDGIEVEVMGENGIKGEKVVLVDFDHPETNQFLVCNQFTVIENNVNKRPDVVLVVNGLPLVVIELKNPTDENATVEKAFTQLQNYKSAIPSLFNYNELLIASDGLDARVGTITSGFSRFTAWKSADGQTEASTITPQIVTLINGLLNKQTFLDLIAHFVVFEKIKKEDVATRIISVETVKKVAAYHQYYAVNKAIEETLRASGSAGDGKAGVVWHTQGSGKSLTMVFYTRKTILHLNNPTVVVITDRNDLDGQLFDTFAGCTQLLRQTPVQAESKGHLKSLLKTASGGIVFTTIQKFFTDGADQNFELLSARKNIVVIADEAHRTQYGFGAKAVEKNGEVSIRYGFAKYLRDALPNASFIGFTGTPVEKADASTPAVFGNYIDTYDIARAVEDGATVRIYYESRLVKVHLDPEQAKLLDDELESLTENEETSVKEKTKAKWAQLEAIVGHKDRLAVVAKDIVEHYQARQEVFDGKAMIVCMSRRVAVELYEAIIALKPEWHGAGLNDGTLKIVMTSSSSDPESWQKHATSKNDRKLLGDRFKDPTDPLKLVIVRDMWLTGFDVPCLHTMYIDKPMRGHNLMQAIARVNRVYKDKPGGLVVDYIGIATDLKEALATYTKSGGMGAPTLDQQEAVLTMLEKFELVESMFTGFNYQRFFTADTNQKLTVILEAQEYILEKSNKEKEAGLAEKDTLKERFLLQTNALIKAFSLSVPDTRAMELKDCVGFFQAVKARLAKFEAIGSQRSSYEIDTAIKQIINTAIVSEGVVDVYSAAGIKKPDISILSDDFLNEVKNMERKNLALELLKKLMADEIRTRIKRNLVQSKKFSEMLENSIKKYQNNLLTTAQVIEELISLAKSIRDDGVRKDELKLTDDEVAFYDALADNSSAKEVLGDNQLAVIAIEVFNSVRKNATIDWTLKEYVRARLRRDVKRILDRYGYPPDQQIKATENVLKQAELMADELVQDNQIW